MIPSSLTLTSGGSATCTLTIVTNSIPFGDYTVTVVGNNLAVTHNTLVIASVMTNDPSYSNQWALPDLSIPQAWKTTTGTRSVVVAVVDSGVMLDHPDIQGNLWTNQADGSHGWNYIDNNNNPYDDFGHGTMVAGIISAIVNNGVGIAGVANEQIMPLEVCDATGNCDAAMTQDAIAWADQHGASIINISLGGFSADDPMQNAITAAWNHNRLVVASVGNAGVNGVTCPACWADVMAIGSIAQGDSLSSFSNYGPKIEIVAPGENIFTTNWPRNHLVHNPNDNECVYPLNSAPLYCHISGTSFSAPYVSGIAALALDYYNSVPHYNPLSSQRLRDAVDYYIGSIGASSGNSGPNPESGNPSWNDHYGYGKPDTLRLLKSMIGSQPLALKAINLYGSIPEGNAQVYVNDLSTDTLLLGWPYVGTGITVSVTSGDTLQVQFVHCLIDGGLHYALDHVNGVGGVRSGSVPAAQPFELIMGAVPASATAFYYTVNSC